MLVLYCFANFCFGTPVLFMQVCACVALLCWQVKNSRQDSTRKSLGPAIYRKRVPTARTQLSGSPGYNSIELAVIVDKVNFEPAAACGCDDV